MSGAGGNEQSGSTTNPRSTRGLILRDNSVVIINIIYTGTKTLSCRFQLLHRPVFDSLLDGSNYLVSGSRANSSDENQTKLVLPGLTLRTDTDTHTHTHLIQPDKGQELVVDSRLSGVWRSLRSDQIWPGVMPN